MNRISTMLCFGLALSLTMVGCAQGSAPNVTPTPNAAVTTPGGMENGRGSAGSGAYDANTPGAAGSAGTMIRPGGSVGNTGSAQDAGQAARDIAGGVGDVARGVMDGVGDAARDIGTGIRDTAR